MGWKLDRRDFLKAAGVGVVAAAMGGCGGDFQLFAKNARKKKPNFVFFL